MANKFIVQEQFFPILAICAAVAVTIGICHMDTLHAWFKSKTDIKVLEDSDTLQMVNDSLDVIISDTSTYINSIERSIGRQQSFDIESMILQMPKDLKASIELKLQYHRWQLAVCLKLEQERINQNNRRPTGSVIGSAPLTPTPAITN